MNKPKFQLPSHLSESVDVSTSPTTGTAAVAAVLNDALYSEAPKTPKGTVADGLVMQDAVKQSLLETAQPLDPHSFPNQPRRVGGQIPCTYANVEWLLQAYGVTARYDIIKKKSKITIPHYSGSPDNFDNVALTLIISLASLNGMATGPISSLVQAVADRNQYNPVADWIASQSWDGVDRLPAFYATLVAREGFPTELKNTLMYRWPLGALAAALKPQGFHSRGVLTLQGEQELGKSAWVREMVSDAALSADVVLENHHLDPSNKDTLIEAARHWIVEFGEVDSMFRKDVARLKGFITAGQDKVRVPYARVASEFQRRTVFVATVNDANFLVDSTGNTRWWTIPVIKVNYKHGINMQQLFAQLAVDFHNGAQWWLTSAESAALELQNRQHRVVSALRERVVDAVDLTKATVENLPAMTPTQVLQAIGINNPTNPQCKETASILRELFGESKRINGAEKWRVPMRYRHTPIVPVTVDDDEY